MTTIEWLRENSMFGCQNERCQEECMFPATELAVAPNGKPVCEGCWNEDGHLYCPDDYLKTLGEQDLDLPSYIDLPCFEPFAYHEGLIHALIEWGRARRDLVSLHLSVNATAEQIRRYNRLADAEGQLMKYATGTFKVTEIVL